MTATGGGIGVWQRLGPPAAFALGVASGLGLLVGRFLLHGNADPLNGGWPLYLQATSFGAALAGTLLSRRPAASAVGVYGGLVGGMLVTRACEYPAASGIALAVHGLLPAGVGALLGATLLACRRGLNPPSGETSRRTGGRLRPDRLEGNRDITPDR